MDKVNSRVLVVGAAGRYAGLVVPWLAERDVSVRGLVRSAEQGNMVIARGAAEYVIGDLRDVVSVKAALRDVDGVFYIAPVYPNDESQIMGRSLVEEANRAGVRRFVFSSVIHPIIRELDNHVQKVPVEEAVIGSGMEFTILRPSHFFQNIEKRWPSILATRVFAEPFATTKRLSYVDYRDVAEVGAIALTQDRLRDGTFDLCGTVGLDRGEVAAIMSEVLGYPIRAEQADVSQWLARLGLPDDSYAKGALGRMYDYYDKHGLVGNPLALRTILGREPRSMHQFFRDLVDGTPTIAHP